MSIRIPDSSDADASLKKPDVTSGNALQPGNLPKKIAAKLLLLVFALVFALGICELVSRYFIDTGAPRHVSDDGKHWNRDHPERGYTLTPGYKGRLTSMEFDNRLEFNSLGLRGPEPDLEAHSAFVLGDSFVFGVGADFDETIGERFAAHLTAEQGRDLQVWNLGVPSYSFQQYLSMLEEHLRRCTPEVVILCAYYGGWKGTANDLLGAVVFQNDRKESDSSPDGASERSEVRLPLKRRIKNWMSRTSAFYNLLRMTLWRNFRLQYVRKPQRSADLQRQLDTGWEIFEAELSRLKALSVKYGFEVVLVSIPDRYGMLDRTETSIERFRDLVAKFDFKSFDGLGMLTREDSLNLYYQHDGHLNPRGYDFFGREIARALRD